MKLPWVGFVMQVSVEVSVCIVVKENQRLWTLTTARAKQPLPFECRKREVMLKYQFAFYYIKL